MHISDPLGEMPEVGAAPGAHAHAGSAGDIGREKQASANERAAEMQQQGQQKKDARL